MNITKKMTRVAAVRKPIFRRPAPRNRSVALQVYAAIVALALILPALVPVFEAFSLHSPGLFVVGLSFLIGFGVLYYLLLRWILDAEVASEADSEEYVQTHTTENSTLPRLGGRAAA